jgi:NO-binding membrane sensor protein with MHYT domain
MTCCRGIVLMLTAHNFTYGLVTPVLAYAMSCLGAFLGLRCTSRAMALEGRRRLRWLLLAALSIGTTGIWVMHFIAMLGYTIPGEQIQYSVPITIASMLIAVVVVGIGLLIVGFARQNWRNLILAGTFTGIGVASMHYTGMAAMRMPARMSYSPGLFALSVVIAIVAATAALWAALRLRGTAITLGAALIMGVAVSGMHYTGMAALHMYPAATAGGMLMTGTGATAVSFLMPLVVGISVVAFILTATLALSPDDEEIRAERELMERLERAGATAAAVQVTMAAPATAPPGSVVSRASQARRQARRQDGSAGSPPRLSRVSS